MTHTYIHTYIVTYTLSIKPKSCVKKNICAVSNMLRLQTELFNNFQECRCGSLSSNCIRTVRWRHFYPSKLTMLIATSQRRDPGPDPAKCWNSQRSNKTQGSSPIFSPPGLCTRNNIYYRSTPALSKCTYRLTEPHKQLVKRGPDDFPRCYCLSWILLLLVHNANFATYVPRSELDTCK